MNFGTLTASQLAFIQVYYIPEDPAVKAAGVEALESLIDAIGEVNQDNSEEGAAKD